MANNPLVKSGFISFFQAQNLCYFPKLKNTEAQFQLLLALSFSRDAKISQIVSSWATHFQYRFTSCFPQWNTANEWVKPPRELSYTHLTKLKAVFQPLLYLFFLFSVAISIIFHSSLHIYNSDFVVTCKFLFHWT